MTNQYDGSIRLEGLDEVLKALGSTKATTRRAVMKGLEKGGMGIIADAKDNLRRNGSVVTGLLRSAGKVQKVGEDGLEAGFFHEGPGSGYALYVENGRRAGKMPPVDEIRAWLKKSHSNKVQMLDAIRAAAVFAKKTYEQMLDSAAWAIAIMIGRNGTQPHPFFAPAVDRNKRKLITRAEEELAKL